MKRGKHKPDKFDALEIKPISIKIFISFGTEGEVSYQLHSKPQLRGCANDKGLLGKMVRNDYGPK